MVNSMNERLLLELVGMLAGGASVSQVLSLFSGNGGSASYDGLQAMIASRNSAFQVGNPLRYRQEDIVRRAEAFIDTLGFNPTTGAAQGVAQLMAHVYKVAPDVVGALIGLPNQQSFYQQLANNSAGISSASGRATSVFNPYSARDAYNHAVNLAHSVSNLAILPDGKGFNIDFTHGLNMDEIGMVTSRLLSSNIPYHRWEEKGKKMGDRLDEESQEFRNELKNLGDKFNSTASMLTKLTGSIKESLKLMDELAGGNFLGGTKAQAEDIARRAQNMAATVRMTAAVAGVSPQEAFQNMRVTQQLLLQRSGVHQSLADVSGYSGMLMNQAANAITSYNIWAASNPGASPMEKDRALFAIQSRFAQYVGTNGEAAAAIVSGHLDLFSKEEQETIKNAYRRGEPDSVRQLIQNRIGIAAYTDYINDPAAIQGFKEAGDQDFLRDMAQAATEGNDTQTHRAGARRMLSHSLSRTDGELSLYTGDRRLRYKDRRDAATDALRRLARENGLSAKGAASMDLDELRNYLNRKGVDPRVIERTIHSAEIERQERDIKKNTMSREEEAKARRNLIRWVDSLGQLTNERKEELRKQINEKNSNLNQIYDNERLALGIKKYDPSILGGKISKAESDRMLSGLAEDKKNWAVDATDEELMRSIKPRIYVASLLGTISLTEKIVEKDFTDAKTDKEALQKYDERARKFIESGKIKITDKETTDQLMAETRKKAFTSVISDVIGGKIGNLDKDSKDRDKNGKNAYDKAIERIRDRVMSGVNKGESIQDAFNSALTDLKSDSDFKKSIGDEGERRIDQLLKDENNEVRKGLNRETIAGKETSLYQQRASTAMSDLYKDFYGANTEESFVKTAEKLVKAGVISEEAWKGIDRSALKTDAGLKAARKLLTPDALNSRVARIAARLGVTRGDPNAVAMAGAIEDAKLQGLGQEDTRKLIERVGKSMGISEERIANLTKSLDDTQAAKNANALSDAINFKEGSFSKKEIERGSQIVADLQKAMGNEREGWKQTLDDLNSKDENKRNTARNRVRDELKKNKKYADKDKLEHAVNYTAALAGSKQDGKTGTELLIDKKSKIESNTLYGAAKSAYSKDDIPYDILTSVNSILDKVTDLLDVTQTMQGIVVR